MAHQGTIVKVPNHIAFLIDACEVPLAPTRLIDSAVLENVAAVIGPDSQVAVIVDSYNRKCFRVQHVKGQDWSLRHVEIFVRTQERPSPVKGANDGAVADTIDTGSLASWNLERRILACRGQEKSDTGTKVAYRVAAIVQPANPTVNEGGHAAKRNVRWKNKVRKKH